MLSRRSAPRCAARLAHAARTRQAAGPAASPRAPARLRRRGKSAACRAPGGVGASGPSPCSSPRNHPAALAIVCLRGAEWCVHAARAWAINCCSCRQAARSRRPSPSLGSSCDGLPASVHLATGDAQRKWARLSQTPCC